MMDDHVVCVTGLPQDQPLVVATEHGDRPEIDDLKPPAAISDVTRILLQDVQGSIDSASTVCRAEV